MKTSFLASVALVLSIVLCGCANAPGRELAASTPIVPNEISDFNVLYGENCAGCHGTDGRGGAAIPLGDPVYLAIADDTIVRRAATNGIPWTIKSICFSVSIPPALCANAGMDVPGIPLVAARRMIVSSAMAKYTGSPRGIAAPPRPSVPWHPAQFSP